MAVQPDFPTRPEVETCKDVERVLRWNRFLPSPQTADQVDVINAVVLRLGELRVHDEAAYVQASKNLGWD